MMDDGSLLFIEALEEHIRAWEVAAKSCEKNALSVEMESAARPSAKKDAEKHRVRIAELRKVIKHLQGRWKPAVRWHAHAKLLRAASYEIASRRSSASPSKLPSVLSVRLTSALFSHQFDWACHKGSKLEYVRLELIWGVMSLAEVRLQEGESIENALRRFKRKVQTEDIIKEVKRHSFYLKPGAKRRVKQALARKRARKKLRKDAD
jgi:small subunit ribosomal protein S21